MRFGLGLSVAFWQWKNFNLICISFYWENSRTWPRDWSLRNRESISSVWTSRIFNLKMDSYDDNLVGDRFLVQNWSCIVNTEVFWASKTFGSSYSTINVESLKESTNGVFRARRIFQICGVPNALPWLKLIISIFGEHRNT